MLFFTMMLLVGSVIANEDITYRFRDATCDDENMNPMFIGDIVIQGQQYALAIEAISQINMKVEIYQSQSSIATSSQIFDAINNRKISVYF